MCIRDRQGRRLSGLAPLRNSFACGARHRASKTSPGLTSADCGCWHLIDNLAVRCISRSVILRLAGGVRPPGAPREAPLARSLARFV
eukprot:6476211-Alexandrium_andersonii.AAC.1